MTYLERQSTIDRRKVDVWHTFWELGQARAALRRMGEQLPEPPARSREAYADALYSLVDGQGEARAYRHLRVLDGGRDTTVEGAQHMGKQVEEGCASGDKPPITLAEWSGHPVKPPTEENR